MHLQFELKLLLVECPYHNKVRQATNKKGFCTGIQVCRVCFTCDALYFLHSVKLYHLNRNHQGIICRNTHVAKSAVLIR